MSNWTPEQFREYAQRSDKARESVTILSKTGVEKPKQPSAPKAHRAGYSLPVVLTFFADCGLPAPLPEYRFDSERLFRFDFAWPLHKVALEVQGGIFARLPGGHNRGAQIRREHEKFSLAACLGWRILYCETETLCTQDTVNLIRRALDWKP